jgi:hypothetical protein
MVAGLMTGRVALLWVNRKVRAILLENNYALDVKQLLALFADRRTSGALPLQRSSNRVFHPSPYSLHPNPDRLFGSLELVVWLVPSLIGDAVTVSMVGILLGPFYPIAMNHAGRVLPRWLLTGSIGWIAGFGQVAFFVLDY